MHRGREGGYRGRGIPMGRGRGGYHPPRGREDYHRYERDDGRDRGRRYDRPRSRSRSPRRYRSRTRSRSRERSRDNYYKDRRSMSPSRKDRGMPDSEGLRITIQPRKEGGYYNDRERRYYEDKERNYYDDRDRTRRRSEKYNSTKSRRRSSSPSSSSSSSSRSKSRSKLNSPYQGRSKDPSAEESLRITVGNDRYQEKQSAVLRLGPPVSDQGARVQIHEYGHGATQRGRPDSFVSGDAERSQPTGLLSSHSGSYFTGTVGDRQQLNVETRETNVPFSGRTPNEDDLYVSRPSSDPFSRSGSLPRNELPSKEPPLPLLPGLAQTLDIDDEDKFLYGDDDYDKPKIEPERHKPPLEPVGLSKLASAYTESDDRGRSHTNQFGDQDYRMRSNQRQRYSKGREDSTGRDSFHERSLERVLYRPSPGRNENFSSRDGQHSVTSSQQNLAREHYQSAESMRPSEIDHFHGVNRYPDGSDGQRSEHHTDILEQKEEKKNVDPTLQNILKSIGFNFELSKLMQEKAEKEREKQEKRQELEYTVKTGGSFMDGGLKNVDLKSVFDEKQNFKDDVQRRQAEEAELRCLEEAKRGTKRSIIGTAETYEQMAKKYREEQARAYEDEHARRSQDKLHPLDYLTESRGRDSGNTRQQPEKGYERYGAFEEKSSYEKTSRDYDARYEDNGRHYKEKLFEDDDGFEGRKDEQRYENSRRNDQRYGDSRRKYEGPGKNQVYEQETRYNEGAQDRIYDSDERYRKETLMRSEGTSEYYDKIEDRQKRRPPQIYGKRLDDGSTHSRSRSPRDQSREKDIYSDSRKPKHTASPPRELAESDLRNVLIASDKASKRTVLPPKADRERIKETQSLRQEDVEQKRAISTLSPKKRELLEKEKEQRRKRLEILESELDKLRKQQGEMMRKKQRQKDGHKDPLLVENSKLQDEITKQITVLRKAVENQNQSSDEGKAPVAAVKFKMEKIPKVVKVQTALVETSSESEEEARNSKRDKEQSGKKAASSAKPTKQVTPQKEDKSKSKRHGSSSTTPSKKEEKKYEKTDKTEGKPKPKFHVNYEFFDAGNHWCRKCNVVSSNVYEVFQHLQKKQHISKMDNYDRPWMPVSLANPKPKSKKGQSVAVPIQGVEFMMSTQAFFCRLCKVFSGDASCAEHHLKSEEHYKKYQVYVNENPFYEQRLNLDKAAGISTATRDGDADKGKLDTSFEKQRRDSGKEDEISAAERVKQQKRAIERQLREKEEEEERKRKEWEDQVKKAEAEREKQSKEAKEGVEKVRLELPATGKIGKMTWAKQQQRLQEKIKQRQEEAKEREAVQQKGKLQFSFGRAPPTFQTTSKLTGPHGPRIDATTFMKKLKEEKERNKVQDTEHANLDQFLSIGDNSLPVVTEEIPLLKDTTAKTAAGSVGSEPLHKSESEKEREEDLRMLGIDPDSTSVMDISNKPPVMAARKPSAGVNSPGASGAASSASSLYGVINPSNTSAAESTLSVSSTMSDGSTGILSNGGGCISSVAPIISKNEESTELRNIPVPTVDEDNHQVDDMDLGSEGSISMGEFEVLDEVA